MKRQDSYQSGEPSSSPIGWEGAGERARLVPVQFTPQPSESMRIGSLQLGSNLFLSPLAGYTNLPFRLTLREVGGLDLATTDLVNARSLLEKNSKALKLIETCPADRPLAVQLFGSVPEEMRDAALYLESLGISAVDVNMGCPVRKVCRVGGGSAMMTQSDPGRGRGRRHFCSWAHTRARVWGQGESGWHSSRRAGGQTHPRDWQWRCDHSSGCPDDAG